TWAARDVSMAVSGTLYVWGRVLVRRLIFVTPSACCFGAATEDSRALAITSVGRVTFFTLAARVSAGFAACGFATTGSGAALTAGSAVPAVKRFGALRRVNFGAGSAPTGALVAADFFTLITAVYFARTVLV